MRLIDANELSKAKFHPLPYTHIVPADLLKAQAEAYERGWNDAIDAIIESAETVNAVEVIRCRDCKFRYDGEYRGRRVMMCDYMDPEPEDKMSDDDFCSRGRKNDAEGCSY